MEAILRKEIITDKTLCRLISVLVFVILMCLGAFVRIPLPFSPVPITLQTFFVLLSGAFLGSGLGAVTQLSYIFLGISGLPIFTGAGTGFVYLFGPTGGYLFGFVLAALFSGKFIKYAKNNLFFIFSILGIADFILLLSGILWLKVIYGYTLGKLLFIGFLPFLLGDLFKALVTSILYLKLKTRLREIF